MLHLVVHHREDPKQGWSNEWSDDNTVLTITTTMEVARQCETAARRGERIRFHRCGYGTHRPLVCAEAQVAAVQVVDKTMCMVRFNEHTLQDLRQVVDEMGLQTQWTMTAEAREYRETQAVERAMQSQSFEENAWLQQQLKAQDEMRLEATRSEELAG